MKGSCLCGAVTYAADAAFDAATACHCTQCRKMSGHYWVSAHVPVDALTIYGTPAWYAASESAERGFCPTCGSFLFWRVPGRDVISVGLGTVDGPSRTRIARHIYCASKGDYYDLADGLPQEP